MSLVEVGWLCGKNESDIRLSTALNSMHAELAWFFLKGGLLGTACLQCIILEHAYVQS
jgi:hypothetical protein